MDPATFIRRVARDRAACDSASAVVAVDATANRAGGILGNRAVCYRKSAEVAVDSSAII